MAVNAANSAGAHMVLEMMLERGYLNGTEYRRLFEELEDILLHEHMKALFDE